MRPRLLIAEPDRFTPAARAALETWAKVEARALPPVAVELRRACEQYDIVWIRLAFRVTAETVRPPRRCSILAVPVTGLDHVDLEACAAAGVRVVSLRGEREFLKEVRATAEHTVALALALLRRIPAAAASVLSGTWDRDLFPGRELYGKTVAIIGMGRLGSITARYFAAFGMRVVGFDPLQTFGPDVAVRAATLEEALAGADLVSVHVNYHPGTRHLLNEAAFRAMPRGAVLINTARGGVVDEQALLAALKDGRLAGAAVDVLDGEPAIDDRHPLIAYARQHPHLLITPHLGGNTFESFEKTEMFIAERVRRECLECGPP